MPAVKHVGLFGALSRRRAAQRNGFDDVLFTDADATISEAASANVGFLDGERVIWPQENYLVGVTMRLIKDARQPHTSTSPVTLSQLADVDAVFATNATVSVRPIAARGNIAQRRGVSSSVGPSGTLSRPTAVRLRFTPRTTPGDPAAMKKGHP